MMRVTVATVSPAVGRGKRRTWIVKESPIRCWVCGNPITGAYVVEVITSRTHDGPLEFHPACKVHFDAAREAAPERYWDYTVEANYTSDAAPPRRRPRLAQPYTVTDPNRR